MCTLLIWPLWYLQGHYSLQTASEVKSDLRFEISDLSYLHIRVHQGGTETHFSYWQSKNQFLYIICLFYVKLHKNHLLLVYFCSLGPQNQDFCQLIMAESARGSKFPGRQTGLPETFDPHADSALIISWKLWIWGPICQNYINEMCFECDFPYIKINKNFTPPQSNLGLPHNLLPIY